ncbi:DUF1127 domain-containing protein [Pseudoroseomonas ludipueritiae]|uniref:DUF1127 domain-containing protein n=1 Tax=Pseudoroseomonas ludipueritiae TaxID=198093 RepID=A0ABR7RB16_9PROT|nr:DUF1127 domain-containing protein [Pseudoroseomonas ludipueritiae]MBC9179019.1 DUF1127 domain-containing protein [Pseudoroseomonas ludipueritiae]
MSAHLGHASPLSSVQCSAPAPLGWSALIRRVVTVVETRVQLQELDERMLRDIGLTRRDALTEAARAPWDVDPGGQPQRL